MKLSVVMPVYNESATLRTVVERVLAVPIEIELLCVDDGSRDGSREMLTDLQSHFPQIRLARTAAILARTLHRYWLWRAQRSKGRPPAAQPSCL